ncbi:MAG: S9 family peptidase [Candidatus Neomarinimicrobiota bacterium]
MASEASKQKPPVGKVSPKRLEEHGNVRIDNYYWLKERDDPEVISYLEAENEYTEAVMAHTEKFQEFLFEEIKGRIKQTDISVPYRLDDYYYYYRYEDGKEYPIHCRKRDSLDGPEEIMLDVNLVARGHEFCSVRGREVSSGQNILAFAVDTIGRRKYTIHFKNLDNGEAYGDVITEVSGNLAWANDNKTLFYAKQDSLTLRSYQIYRHALGTDVSQDELVYEEKDETFSSYVWRTKSKKYLMIGSFQTLSHEYRFLDADDPSGEFKVFLKREPDHEYDVDHFQDKFYIRTNFRARNFRLMETPTEKTGRENWRELIPNRDDVFLSGFTLFRDHLVLQERKKGLVHIRIVPWSDEEEHDLDFGEPAYLAYVANNPDMNTPVLRYGYTSMTTPNSVFDYNMETRDKTLMKRDEVLGGFDSNNYETLRLFATADDGIEIPISIVYRKGKKNGGNPLLLYGYGSYGASMDATFSSPRLSLIDRGFIYAIAHVRGGQELGRAWYEDGKLLKKKNTFTDFIACAEYLIQEGYTSSDELYAMGGSAGGLLMGAVVNMAPDLFNGVVARVPWVDIVTTMLDSEIPLTTSEYDEWGDPNDKKYYDYMLSYSPYDNVVARDYPNLLVTTGLHDSQVQYWEPAKWVAKLRAVKTDGNRLLLKTNMQAGHGGRTGRYKRYEDTAFIYAFLLDLAEITK